MEISTYQNQGTRDYQEDRYVVIQKFHGYKNLTLCIVCDGHGGSSVSTFLIEHYPIQLKAVFDIEKAKPRVSQNHNSSEEKDRRKTFGEMLGSALELCIEIWDKKCFGSFYGKIHNDTAKKKFFSTYDSAYWEKHNLEAGSTFVCMLIDTTGQKAHTVTLGDSRASWIIDDNAISQTVDHKVKRKMPPVKGFKCVNSDGRLQGDLAMAGAVGDNTETLYGLVSREYKIGTINLRGRKSFRAVIASDGLYDVLEPQAVLYESFTNATEIAKYALELIKTRERDIQTRILFEQCEKEGIEFEKINKNKAITVVPEFDDNVSIIYIKMNDLQQCFQPPTSVKSKTKKSSTIEQEEKICVENEANNKQIEMENEEDEQEEGYQLVPSCKKQQEPSSPQLEEMRQKLEKVQLLINDLTKNISKPMDTTTATTVTTANSTSKMVRFASASPVLTVSLDTLPDLAKKKASIERRKHLLQQQTGTLTQPTLQSVHRKSSIKRQTIPDTTTSAVPITNNKKNETFQSFQDGNLTMNFMRKSSIKR